LIKRKLGVTNAKTLATLQKNFGANNKPKNQSHLVQDETSDSGPVMLMARTNEDEEKLYLGI